MESVPKEEREVLNEVYGRALTDDEANEIIRNLTEYFKLLIEANKQKRTFKWKLTIKPSCSAV